MTQKSQSASPWPDGKQFALFLSHDVDEIYDRELFRLLGDVNHLRRMWFQGEPGATWPCVKRVGRSLVRPRTPGHDIEAILAIERNAGVRSTFFLLEDRTFNRLGGRYRYDEPEVKAIARRILDAGYEIAVHGAYHNFNDPERYHSQARSFLAAFGLQAQGIRNHYLRHDGPATWRAQRAAGFAYDATFGLNERPGVRDGRTHPFFSLEGEEEVGAPNRGLVVLPITVMDCTLFRRKCLSASEALAICEALAVEIRAAGGLVCLSWHNNYFNEPEYVHWERVYEELLGRLLDWEPYCATGEEIAGWWRGDNQEMARRSKLW